MLVIANWDEIYENNRTRDMKDMKWVPVPNTHDGDGYTELLDHEDGAAHFAAWVVMLQLASRCGMRGTLLRDNGRAYDSASISRRTRIPRGVIDQAIPRLLLIGWLRWEGETPNPYIDASDDDESCYEIPQEGAGKLRAGCGQPAGAAHPTDEGKERKGREGKGKERKEYSPPFEKWWSSYPRKEGKQEAYRVYRQLVSRLSRDSRLPSVVEGDLLVAVETYAKSPRARHSDRDFIPLPATWLSEGRYEDDPVEWNRPLNRDPKTAPSPPLEQVRSQDATVDRNVQRGKFYKPFVRAHGRAPDSDAELDAWIEKQVKQMKEVANA